MEQEPQNGTPENKNNEAGQTGKTNPPKIRLTPTTSTTGGAIPKPKIKLQASGSSGSAIPPLTEKPAAAAKPVEEKAEAVPVKPAPGRRPDTVSVPPLDTPKPQTHTGPIVEASSVPKTIKIKRPGTATLKPPTIESQKKQTSRVDINAALAENATSEAPPRTIKLKRPGTTVLEKASPEPSPDRTTQFKIDNARKSETSRIELPAEATVEMPKRRKTVQIKRSGSGGGGGAPAVRRPGTRLVMNTSSSPAVSSSLSEDDIPDIVITDDESTVVFSLVSLVATIVTLVVLYVLAAQTILPSLPWAGKL